MSIGRQQLLDRFPKVARGGEPPVTLAEFTLNGGGDQDYYDISLVDGFNLPMIMRVVTPYARPNMNEVHKTGI